MLRSHTHLAKKNSIVKAGSLLWEKLVETGACDDADDGLHFHCEKMSAFTYTHDSLVRNDGHKCSEKERSRRD